MANEQAAEELDLGEEKSGKSKLIIIIAIVAVLLIGGGVAAYFLLMGGDEATDEGEAASEQTAEAEVEQGPPHYIDMKTPFVVNLPGKPSLLQIGVSVRVRSDEMAEFIKHND
ncbi:MAG: flagellar biosynthesis protein FliL, partial [Candidatus Thiodiazotropha sp.]